MDAPRKWRIRFGLRALLVAIGLIAVPLAWTGYSLRWIQQRQAFRDAHLEQQVVTFVEYAWPNGPVSLWLFHEDGVAVWNGTDFSKSEIAEVQRLFPEAEIAEKRREGVVVIHGPGQSDQPWK